MMRSVPVLLILATLFWAGDSVIGKLAVSQMSGIELAFWRWLLACLILLPLAWTRMRRDSAYYRQHWPWMVTLSLLSVASYNTLQYVALQYTLAINVGVVATSMPLVVFLMAWLLGQERAGTRQWLGLGSVCIGALLILSRGEGRAIYELAFNRGDLMMLAAVCCFALYSVLLRRVPERIDRLGLLLVLISLGVLAILPLYLWERQFHDAFELTPLTGLALLYVGVFPSLLAYYFWNRALSLGSANTASLYYNLVAVFTSILAVVFLGETLAWYHLAGMTAVMVGIVTASSKPERPGRIGSIGE